MTSNNTELNELQQELEEAKRAKNPEAIIKASKNLINYHQVKGEITECIIHFKTIIPFIMKSGNELELAINICNLAKCHLTKEEYNESEDFFYKALAIYQDTKNEMGIAEIESNLGLLFRHRGAFDVSLSHLTKAISIYNDNKREMELNKISQHWQTYINVIECCGIIYGQLHQFDQSVKYLEDALLLKEEHAIASAKVSTLMNLGVTYSEIDVDKAMDYYLQALALTNDHTPMYHKVVLLNNLGGCLEDTGKLEDALKYYFEALKIMDTTGQFHYRAPIHKHIGTVYYKQGLYDDALKQIELSMNILQKTGAKSEIQDCYLLLSDVFTAKSEYQIALDYRVKYDTLKDEIFQQNLSTQLTDLQKKYETTTLSVNSLRYENSLITDELKKAMNASFIGVSNSIKEVQRLAMEASVHKDTRVLITGESGVGKEIVARLIHYSDTLKKGRFVDVNCCSIPDSLAESEFFGYARGAFTGAINSKSGYFEEANFGTLFLDEIGDMPIHLQAKLLRVLETKQVKRLGSNTVIPVEFRLVSATNKKLSELIQKNLFRADLLYRINTVAIHIPPLRERKEDIQPLLEHYLAEFTNRMNKTFPQYDKEIINCLSAYDFPGNVRELRNMIEKSMIFIKNNKLKVEDFSSQMHITVAVSPSEGETTYSKLQDVGDYQLLKILDECGGNQTVAAQKLGISYSTFKRRYKKLRLN